MTSGTKQSFTYKRWAPTCLQKEHARLARKLAEYEQQAAIESRREAKHLFTELAHYQSDKKILLERLIARDEMQQVWNTLGRQNPRGHELDFFEACDSGLWFQQNSTKKNVLKKADAMARLARELSKQLAAADVMAFGTDSLYSLVPAEDFPVIGRIEGVSGGKGSSVEGESLPSFQAEYAFIHSNGSLKSSDAPGMVILLPSHPTVANLLDRLADHVEARARAFVKNPMTLTKPGAANAHRTHFIIHLTRYLRETYRRPLRDVVANTSSALFLETITAGHVRSIAP